MMGKEYIISGVKCTLEMDHTLRETMEIEQILSRAGNIVMEDSERLLSLILKCEKPVEVLEMKESQLTEIVTDYMLQKKSWRENLLEKCLLSTLNQSGLSQKSEESQSDNSVT